LSSAQIAESLSTQKYRGLQFTIEFFVDRIVLVGDGIEGWRGRVVICCFAIILPVEHNPLD
jgi:hypothetical protein